jgi:hypothetical protein
MWRSGCGGVDVVEGSVEDVAVSFSRDLTKMPLLYQFC